MEETRKPSHGRKKTSKELLSVTGDGSSRSVVQSLLRQRPKPSTSNKPKTFMVARSPLLDQLQAFLPEFQKSTQELLSQPTEKLANMDIENTEGDKKVIEMNVIVGAMASDGEESNEDFIPLSLGRDSSSDSESDDSSVLGPVTVENLKIPPEAKGGKKRKKNLIQEVFDEKLSVEGEKSDSEITVASTSSGER
ncbi:NOP protein chaperone 1-like isoform X2 [Panulirus ornatus]